MTTFTDIGSVAIVLIGWFLGLSGWGKIIYDWFTSKPKIKGQIINVIIATTRHPLDVSRNVTAFLVYVYLGNLRKNPISILDYRLDIDTGSGFERMTRIYGGQKIQNWSFSSEDSDWSMPDFNKKLLTHKMEPLEYGKPTHGFLIFCSENKPMTAFMGKVKEFKITCIDAFQNKHEIKTSPKNFPSLALFQDITDLEKIRRT